MTTRPKLDKQDLETVRQVYGEAQQWARHYEALVVSTNVLIVSASLVFVGLLFEPTAGYERVLFLLFVALGMLLVGGFLTELLFRLYSAALRRIIRIENLLNCFDDRKFADIDGMGPLVPKDLTKVSKPPAILFFELLYLVLGLAYIGSAYLRPG